MREPSEQHPPVAVKALLVDPRSMMVVWANEAAAEGLLDSGSAAAQERPVEEVLPIAATLGIPDALREVAATGDARHLRASLVSTATGTLSLASSVYRLPDGMLLVLMENAWQARTKAEKGEGTPRRTGRQTR